MLKYIFNDCEKIKPLIEEFTNKENAKKKLRHLGDSIEKDLILAKINRVDINK